MRCHDRCQPTRDVERGEVVGGQLDVQRVEIGIELFHGGGTNESAEDPWPGGDPVERDLRRRSSDVCGYRVHGVRDAPVPVGQGDGHGPPLVWGQASRPGAGGRVPVIFAGEETVGEGGPGHDGHAEVLCCGQVFPLDAPLGEGVFHLQGGGWLPPAVVGQRLGFGGPPGRDVAQSDGADLPAAYQRVEGGHHLVDVGELVPYVEPIEVDVVGLQAAQRCLDGGEDVLATVTAAVGVGRVGRAAEFGGDDQPVPVVGFPDEPAQEFFAGAASVDVGGVDEGAAAFEVAMEDGAG